MNLRYTLLSVVLLLILSAPLMAVTFSENEAIFKGDDPRLEQTIDFSADGLRVVDVLAQLSQKTGVEMSAGLHKDDWMVQDRKVIIHVKNVTLRYLMQEIASILRFHWSRGKGDDGVWSYRLWQDKLQRNEEESLRAAAKDGETRKFRERRENALADIANLGSLSKADADALRTDNPWRYVIATEPLGQDVAAFMNSFPEARNAFVQGHEVSFPVASLDPDLQAMVSRIASSYDSLIYSIGASEDHSELLDKFEKLQITVNRRKLGGAAELISHHMLGHITIGSGAESFEIPIFDPSSPMAKAIGRAIVNLKSGMAKEEVGKKLQAEMAEVMKMEEEVADISDSIRDISSDPQLRKEIKLFDQPMMAILPMALKAIAEETGYNVISDYFPGTKTLFKPEEKSLGNYLEQIRVGYGSNWEKVGSTLRFRDSEWFRKRAWEVPQVWIDYWLAVANQNDRLGLDELVQIGCLRDEQLDHTIMTHHDLVSVGAGEAARNRHILKFYGSLTADQKAQIRTQPIKASSLTEQQWALLQTALATKGAAYAVTQKGEQLVQLSISGDTVTDYKFIFHPEGGEAPVTFSMSTGVAYKTADQMSFPDAK